MVQLLNILRNIAILLAFSLSCLHFVCVDDPISGKEKKAVGTYMAQSTIRRVKEKLDNYITISDLLEIISLMDRIWMKTLFQNWQKRFPMRMVW